MLKTQEECDAESDNFTRFLLYSDSAVFKRFAAILSIDRQLQFTCVDFFRAFHTVMSKFSIFKHKAF